MAFANLISLDADPVLNRLLEEFDGVIRQIVAGDPRRGELSDHRRAAASLCRLSREIRLRLVELGVRASASTLEHTLEVLQRIDETKGRVPEDANVTRSLTNARMRLNWLQRRLDSCIAAS